MTEPWDIDRFPLKNAARQTPGQEGADKFLRAVNPEDIERLIREDADTSHGNTIGAETGGPVHVHNQHMDSDYGEGYNRPDRSYEDETGEYGHRPGHEHPELQDEYTLDDPDNYRISPDMIFGGPDWDDDEEEGDPPGERQYATYHVGVRPRGMPEGSPAHEIRVHRLEHPDYDFEPDEAWGQLMMEHPHNFHEDNPNRSHDIIFAHPEAAHDDWQRELDAEDHQFRNRIEPHGFRRESPDVLGHQAYRIDETDEMGEPNGVSHRLWHNHYSANGPGWHTSRYDARLPREQQPVAWTEHPDRASEDSLSDALAQVTRNRTIPPAPGPVPPPERRPS